VEKASLIHTRYNIIILYAASKTTSNREAGIRAGYITIAYRTSLLSFSLSIPFRSVKPPQDNTKCEHGPDALPVTYKKVFPTYRMEGIPTRQALQKRKEEEEGEKERRKRKEKRK